MPLSKTGVFAISFLALALAGCQSGRFNPVAAPSPQPLPAAPSGTVTGSQLPPPVQPGMQPGADQAGVNMAAVDPSAQAAAAASAAPLEKNSLLGSWTVNSAGTSCQMFLTLTKYGNSSRGGTRGCANELASMRAWDLSGNQVVVYDENGNTIARLYSGGSSRLDGQTMGGTLISASR